MNHTRKTFCFLVIILLICALAGCRQHNDQKNGIPLPPSAKQLSKSTIEIPFPQYSNDFLSGEERWIIERVNSPDNLIFNIIYKDKVISSFPLGKVGAGTYNINGSIELSGKKYKIISITLNNDLESGTIELKKVA